MKNSELHNILIKFVKTVCPEYKEEFYDKDCGSFFKYVFKRNNYNYGHVNTMRRKECQGLKQNEKYHKQAKHSIFFCAYDLRNQQP